MFAYDVDGDGDNDVITSIDAHAFGLAWFEQIRESGKITFVKRPIMGRMPEDNPYGVVFTELHTVNLTDMDGDGLKGYRDRKDLLVSSYGQSHVGRWSRGLLVQIGSPRQRSSVGFPIARQKIQESVGRSSQAI